MMNHVSMDTIREARERAWSMPLADLAPADPQLFKDNAHWPYFERLRKEDAERKRRSGVA